MIEFDNGSRIVLLAVAYQPGDPKFDDLGSTEYTGGFMEEAQESHEEAFNVLKTRVNRNNKFIVDGKNILVPAKILLTANPHKGYLKRLFVDPDKKGLIPATTEERLQLQKPYLDSKTAMPDNLLVKFIPAFYTDNAYLPEDYYQSLETGDTAQTQRLKYGD